MLGRIFHLKKQIGKGGEGAVYEVTEATDIAIKLYWPDKAQSRRAKISAMASAQWYKTAPFVAFPIDALFSPTGAFVGYVMKKVTGSKPVHMLYSPASRMTDFPKANYQFLTRAAWGVPPHASNMPWCRTRPMARCCGSRAEHFTLGLPKFLRANSRSSPRTNRNYLQTHRGFL
jgi:hypothetical protein